VITVNSFTVDVTDRVTISGSPSAIRSLPRSWRDCRSWPRTGDDSVAGTSLSPPCDMLKGSRKPNGSFDVEAPLTIPQWCRSGRAGCIVALLAQTAGIVC
jgi:hypothetical protein